MPWWYCLNQETAHHIWPSFRGQHCMPPELSPESTFLDTFPLQCHMHAPDCHFHPNTVHRIDFPVAVLWVCELGQPVPVDYLPFPACVARWSPKFEPIRLLCRLFVDLEPRFVPDSDASKWSSWESIPAQVCTSHRRQPYFRKKDL